MLKWLLLLPAYPLCGAYFVGALAASGGSFPAERGAGWWFRGAGALGLCFVGLFLWAHFREQRAAGSGVERPVSYGSFWRALVMLVVLVVGLTVLLMRVAV